MKSASDKLLGWIAKRNVPRESSSRKEIKKDESNHFEAGSALEISLCKKRMQTSMEKL